MPKSVESTATGEQGPKLSTKTLAAITAVRKPFTSFARDFRLVNESRADLAPRFMKAFGLYQSDGGGSFVSFVAMLDQSVPTGNREYRNHPAYQAAEYLRRLVSRRDTRGRGAQPLRGNSLLLARTIATILPLVRDAETFWKEIAAELSIRPRALSNLRKNVQAARPLITLPKVKPADVRIIHQAEPEAAAA